MKPAVRNLAVVPGTTYRDTVRLMQPVLVYKRISSISGAPAVLVVPGHGVEGDWPVWLRAVTGMQGINREPPTRPLRARRIDADTLEINELSAAGFTPRGGELMYQLPVDLVGTAPRMTLRGAVTLELVPGAGLELSSPGTIVRTITAEQTEALGTDWNYIFDVEFSDASVTRFFEGGPDRGGCGCE